MNKLYLRLTITLTFLLLTGVAHPNELRLHEIEIDVAFLTGKLESSRTLLEEVILDYTSEDQGVSSTEPVLDKTWVFISRLRLLYLYTASGEKDKAHDQLSKAIDLGNEIGIYKIGGLRKCDRMLVAFNFWLRWEENLGSKIDNNLISRIYKEKVKDID